MALEMSVVEQRYHAVPAVQGGVTAVQGASRLEYRESAYPYGISLECVISGRDHLETDNHAQQ